MDDENGGLWDVLCALCDAELTTDGLEYTLGWDHGAVGFGPTPVHALADLLRILNTPLKDDRP